MIGLAVRCVIADAPMVSNCMCLALLENVHSPLSLGPPQNFTVNQYEMDDGKFLTNISWTPQASDLKYYLHVNTSDGKQLYMIDGQVQLMSVRVV